MISCQTLAAGATDVIINVAQRLKAEVGTTRQYDLDDWLPAIRAQAELTEPVRGKVRLTRTNRGILVQADLSTAVRLECSRCLELFVQKLPIRFAEEYIPEVDVETGLPAHIPHESYAFRINEKHELDLAPAVREYGDLELPMQPLCRSDCAGLCPQCGANRNLEPCQCSVSAADERFAVLRALLPDDDTDRPTERHDTKE
jgi:uncharacterized protein